MTFDFSGKSSDLTQYAVNPLNIDSSLPNSTDLLNLSNTNKSSYDSSSYVLESQNIITGSTFTDNSGSNFIGDSNKPWDDAFIYAESGVVFNSIPTLSALPGALTLGPDGTFNSPHQVADELLFSRSTQSLTIEIPTYDSLQSEALAPFSSTPDSLLNYFQQPLNTSADVESAFPSNDGEVLEFQVAEGSLNLPTGSRLHNLMITVENGDINFNGDVQELSNVTLVAKNGNVNLGGVQATGVSVLASGSINMNNAALFSGNNLLATKDGSVVFNGSTVTTNSSDSMLVVANGNIIFNAAADTRANFLASGSFTANSASKIIGSVKTQGDIIFNAPVQVIADNVIDPNQPAIALIDTGVAANNPDFDYRRFIPLKDYVDNDNNPFLNQGEGSEHGTHIAGIIGATQNNGIGIDGINNEAPIYVSRAIGSGNWAQALTDSVDAIKLSGQPNGVVNLALDLTQVNPDGTVTTRYEFTPTERQALEYARQEGVLIVAAAGNDGGTMSVLGQASQEYDNIVTVGSVDYQGKRNEYSNYGYGLDLVSFGGTVKEPVISTVGAGVDVEKLLDSDNPIEDEMSTNALNTFEEVFGAFSDVASPTADETELENLTLEERQVYDEATKEIDQLLANYLDAASQKLALEYLDDYHNASVDALSQFVNTFDDDFAYNLLKAKEILGNVTGNANPSTQQNLGFSVPFDLGIGEMAGTSVATAQVTGVASQAWAANPSLNYSQIKDILKSTAKDLNTPGWDLETGSGLVNMTAAVELAKQTKPEDYQPQPLLFPLTWTGEGRLIPGERAVAVTPVSSFAANILDAGYVNKMGFLRVRSGPGTDKSGYREIEKKYPGDIITFDAYENNGEWVPDPYMPGGGSSSWYRIAGTNYWMSGLYFDNTPERADDERRRQEDIRKAQEEATAAEAELRRAQEEASHAEAELKKINEEQRRKQELWKALVNQISQKYGDPGLLMGNWVDNGVTVYQFEKGQLLLQPDGHYVFYQAGKGANLVAKVGSVLPHFNQLNNGGIVNDAYFSQSSYSNSFSNTGRLAGWTQESLVNALKKGTVKPSDIEIEYITRNGKQFILNTRSSMALEKAGIPRNQWNIVNRTNDLVAQRRLTEQFTKNKFIDNQGNLILEKLQKNKPKLSNNTKTPSVNPKIPASPSGAFAKNITKGARIANKFLRPISIAVDAYRLYDAYQKDGGEFGQNFKTTTGGIAGAWAGATAGAWAGAKTGAWAGGIIGSAIPFAGTAAGAAAGGLVGGLIGGGIGAIVGSGAGEWLVNNGTDAVNDAFNAAKEKAKAAIEKANALAEQAKVKVEQAKATVQQAQTAYQNFKSEVKKATTQIVQQSQQKIQEEAKKIRDVMLQNPIVQKAPQVIKHVANYAKTAVQVVSNAIDTARKFANSVIETGKQFVNNVVETGKQAYETVKNFVVEKVEQGKQVATETVKKVDEAVNTVTNYVSGGLNNVKSFFGW